MEWYLWLLIGYAVWVFISLVVGYIKDIRRKKLIHLFYGVFVYITFLVIAPYYILISLYHFLTDDTTNYETFTIHELSEDNKTALKNIGFIEGEYISYNNFDYKGFRNSQHNISILYNGRISIRYGNRLSREQKHLIKQIKALPRPINPNQRREELERTIQDKKNSIKTWQDFYQKDIDELQKEVNKLKKETKEVKPKAPRTKKETKIEKEENDKNE